MTGKMKIAIVAVFCCLLAFVAAGGTIAWAQGYDGRIGPRTFVGAVEVSGMDPETARQAVQRRIDAFLANGVSVTLDGTEGRVSLSSLLEASGAEIVRFDLDATIRAASAANHDENGFWDATRLLEARMTPTTIRAVVSGNEDSIAEAVRAAFPSRERPGVDATFAVTKSGGAWKATVVPGTSGEEFDLASFRSALLDRLATLSDAPVALVVVRRDPNVTEAVASAETDIAAAALSRAPFALSLPADPAAPSATWKISASDLATMLRPGPNGLDIDAAALNEALDVIAAAVDVPAQNARFERAGGRVVEFATSKTGRAIDRDRARTDLVAALNSPSAPSTTATPPIILAFVDVEPTVASAQANDLGIADLLGTGTSSFKGSPKNRMSNIQNGVNLLNGLLIAPDETFSLLNALKPFETENGYFPELVIKGDKILPEIAGGLCQIGTTTFRAAMNAGLEIVQRSNHSLVVSYYNDPSNGNPGTDATIYDPAPDFQFRNDTGHYVLFETSMDATAQSLAFSLWGTSDGRKGSYTPPVVKRWIPAGDPVETETTTIPVGEKKCQNVHVGADTSFTYTVAHPDGTSVDRVFESHYRPLPQICLVGVEQLSTPEDLQPAEDSVSSLVTTDAPVTN